jgi:hypothetical protein
MVQFSVAPELHIRDRFSLKSKSKSRKQTKLKSRQKAGSRLDFPPNLKITSPTISGGTSIAASPYLN